MPERVPILEPDDSADAKRVPVYFGRPRRVPPNDEDIRELAKAFADALSDEASELYADDTDVDPETRLSS